MSALLLDTQAVVWMLFSPDKLSETARQAIDTANQNGATFYISALSLVELTFLVKRCE
jgi:PIN domain nuclease of toxin-antitoxin system